MSSWSAYFLSISQRVFLSSVVVSFVSFFFVFHFRLGLNSHLRFVVSFSVYVCVYYVAICFCSAGIRLKISLSFGQFFHSRRRCRFCCFSVVAVVVVWVSLAAAAVAAVFVVVAVVAVVLNQISIILFVAIFITFRFHSRLSACNKAQSESLVRRKKRRENRRKSEKSGKWKIAYNTHTHTHTERHTK